jgi:hypothetical protein
MGIPHKARFREINMALPARMRSKAVGGTRQSLALYAKLNTIISLLLLVLLLLQVCLSLFSGHKQSRP